MQLNQYQLFVVRFGTRATSRSDHFLGYHLYGEPDGPMDIDYFFWVALGAEQTVLIDCGFSRRAGDRPNDADLSREALREVGVHPDEVDDVVVTHAHYDHAGNLGLFPRARVVIAASELAF